MKSFLRGILLLTLALFSCEDLEHANPNDPLFVIQAPTDLKVIVLNDTEFQISWKDNSDNEDGFNVERDSGDGFDEIAIVNPNENTFVDSELSSGNRYLYRVRAFAQSKQSEYTAVVSGNSNEVVDVDGNIYNVIRVGNQTWMAENLRVTHYRDGHSIDNLQVAEEWSSTNNGAFCYYANDTDNNDKYGSLYNWYSVSDNRNIAPEGWHIPTDEEWKALEVSLGMSVSVVDNIGWRGINEGGMLKAIGSDNWSLPNSGASNNSGFSAIGSGYRTEVDGEYRDIGLRTYFWTSSENNPILSKKKETAFHTLDNSNKTVMNIDSPILASPFFVYKTVNKNEASTGAWLQYTISFGTQEGISFMDSVFIFDFLPMDLQLIETSIQVDPNTIYEGLNPANNIMKFSRVNIFAYDSLQISFSAEIIEDPITGFIENLALITSHVDSSWSDRNPRSRARTNIVPEIQTSRSWVRGLSHTDSTIYRGSFSQRSGFSIRCVRD